jgi:hypothetical protein
MQKRNSIKMVSLKQVVNATAVEYVELDIHLNPRNKVIRRKFAT